MNGNINKIGFQKIYNSANISKSIPCIINAAKVNTGSEDNALKQAVSEVIKDTDADGHYVNTCIYFFKNTFQQENISDLISKNFNTVFYSKDEGNTFRIQRKQGDLKKFWIMWTVKTDTGGWKVIIPEKNRSIEYET